MEDFVSNLDFRLVLKEDTYGKRYLALNLGRDYLETSIFLTKEHLEYLLQEDPKPIDRGDNNAS